MQEQPQKEFIVEGGANWHMKLADAVQNVAEGGRLVVESDTTRELAMRAIGRMRPNDGIEVVVRKS